MPCLLRHWPEFSRSMNVPADFQPYHTIYQTIYHTIYHTMPIPLSLPLPLPQPKPIPIPTPTPTPTPYHTIPYHTIPYQYCNGPWRDLTWVAHSRVQRFNHLAIKILARPSRLHLARYIIFFNYNLCIICDLGITQFKSRPSWLAPISIHNPSQYGPGIL